MGPARGVRIISELLRELFHEVHVGEDVGYVIVPIVFVFDGNGAVKTDFAQGGEGLIQLRATRTGGNALRAALGDVLEMT